MARAERATLRPRILSALVLAPLPIAAIWFGSPWLPLLTAAAAGAMGWEWARLCRGGRVGRSGVLLIGTVVAAVVAAALAGVVPALAVALVGAALLLAVALWLRDDAAPGWLALGAVWVALPCVLLLWLAAAQGDGRFALLWVLAIVWATDIGAYICGRALGGPRLAPRWSPRKTWAGLLGGILCAALAGWATAWAVAMPGAGPLALLSAGLAIVEQFGDLAESVVKRRFGVKDSSGLIPGHGGLLDRLDGLLAVVPAVALLTMIRGESVLAWR